ncbi:MAG: FG-GAP-like repeat-containing protein [Sediminibacterium sp.]
MKKITFILTLCLLSSWSFAQDNCASALPITAGLHIVTGVNGTDIPSPICADNGVIAGTNGKGEWYTYSPTQNYTVTITTDISQNTPRVDTRLHVYTGICSNLSCAGGDDDSGANYSSIAVFNVTAGTTYIIAFDNRWSSNGFTFQLSEGPFVPTTPQRVTYTTQNIATVNSSYNLCIVDMNGDRKDDIAGVSANNLRIHYQGAGGTFTNTDFPITGTSNMPSWSLAAGDYNKDGYNDLILGGGSAVTFWKSNSTGTNYTNETFSQYVFCQRTNFVDLNNDGNLDAFSCHDVDPNVYFMNNGSGVLTFYQSGVTPGATTMGIHTEGGNYGSIFVDYDNDGDQDLFIAKCRGGAGTAKFNELHKNNGNGTFADVSVAANLYDPIQTWSSAWADYDNDGDLDIVVGASSTADGNHKYMRNNADGTFTDTTAGTGWDTNTSTNVEHIAYDFDNNGFVDVMGGGNKIMYNQGNGTFTPFNHGFGVSAVGDLNNDGFLDFQSGTTLRINSGNSNKWLKLNLQGIQSNRNGIGARVEIYGEWGKQIRDVRSGEGFKYMSTLNVHFGIGTATTINQVIVRWPSGVVDIFNNLNPNQTLLVVEGATLGNNSFENFVFTMYPNPVKNTINISINTANPVEFISAEIYDLTGRRVQTSLVQNQSVNVDLLSTGTYILKLTDSNNENYSQKFIKE